VELCTVGVPPPVSVAVVPVATPAFVSLLEIVSVEPAVCSFGLPPHAASEATIAATRAALAIKVMPSSSCANARKEQQGPGRARSYR
jgi:hypothetical protein